MSEELKPCPFCGAAASIVQNGAASTPRKPGRLCVITCANGCFEFNSDELGDEQGTAWNTRAAIKAGQGEAVEVVAHLILGGIFDGQECGDIDYQIEPDVAERLQHQNVKTAEDVQLELMTVAQHQRIVAAITAPPATGVIVDPGLLRRVLSFMDSTNKNYPMPYEMREELRALLAQQEVKS